MRVIYVCRIAFQEHLFAVMRFMKERKLIKKTRARVIAYHNVLWQAYRSNIDPVCSSPPLA